MSTGSLCRLCTETDLESEETSTVDTLENTDVKIQKPNLEYEQLNEEDKRRHKKILEDIQRIYYTAAIKKTCTDKHFRCLNEFVSTLKQIRKSSHYFNKFPLKICEDSKQKAGDCLAESGFVLTVCDFLVEGLKTEKYEFDDSPGLWYQAQKEAFSVIWNFTDCSREVGRIVNDHKYLLPLLVGKLWEWHETFMVKVKNEQLSKDKKDPATEPGPEPSTTEGLPRIPRLWHTTDAEVNPDHLRQERISLYVKTTLHIFHNIAMHDVIEKLRELQASLILVKYLNSMSQDKNIIRVITAATLAELMTDEEADNLIASRDVARFLLSLLKKALRAKDHRCIIDKGRFSVTELVRAVKQLARNDANKKMLVNKGVLPLLSQGLQAEYLPEQNICLEALWMLCFEQQNREEMMQEQELLKIIINLYSNRFVNDHTQKLTQGILWQLRHELLRDKEYADVTKFLKVRTNVKTATCQHVMLSYQRDDRDLVLQIRNCLKKEGYKVWIDVDSIEGSTAEAMAFAVEQAFVVILCMSQKYKDSMYCRAEAEYAFKSKKKVVPLLMQSGYNPDGWLGLVVGAKMFYDFSGKYTFDSRIKNLLRELRGDGKNLENRSLGNSDEVTSVEQLTKAPRATTSLGQLRSPLPPIVAQGGTRHILPSNGQETKTTN